MTVSSGSTVTLDGSASSDADGDALTYVWSQVDGTPVTLTGGGSSATATFVAPTGPATVVFKLIVSDGVASSDPDTVTITVSNPAVPFANAGADQSVTFGSTVTLDGTASTDPNGASLTYAWTQTTGPAVTLSSSTAAQPTFTAPSSATTVGFQLVVNNGMAPSAPDTVNIVVSAVPDQAPTANAGPDQTVAAAATVTLDGTGSTDPESSALTYLWSQISGPTVTLSTTTGAQPTFTAPSHAATFVFRLVVNDGVLSSAPDDVTITVPNQAPTANAGPDQIVAGGATVMLTGAGSTDPEGTSLTYQWQQLSGPAVTLSSATSVQPSFTAPSAAAALVFQLVVNDGALSSSPDTVTITVPNQAPVANAGPDQNVGPSATVALDGTGSTDPEGSALTYSWLQTSGPAVTLSSSTAAQPTFTSPSSGATLVFQLVVNDGSLSSAPDAVMIVVPNQPPTANAGPDQNVGASATVTLDGTSSSDPEGMPLTYAWLQTSGPTVTLSSATAAQPSFTSPAYQATLVFSLIVSDGMLISSADTVTISVPNQKPTANAGPDQSVGPSATVALTGTASTDPEGSVLTYSWVQTSGPAVTLSSATAAQPTFTAPAYGSTLVFSLTVNDGSLSSSADTVSITVPNQKPTANAGPDQTVPASSLVTLDGTASSDPEGTALSYSWLQTSGPVVTLSSNTAAKPTFTASAAAGATVTFQLTVSDGALTSTADTVSITTDSNVPPIAHAGPDDAMFALEDVTLDGTASTDEGGATLTYQWTQTAGPAVTLSSNTAAKPTFTAPDVAVDTTLTFSLVVNDGTYDSTADSVSITVMKYAGNRASPTTQPTMTSAGGMGSADIEISGNYAYVGGGSAGFAIYDVSTPLGATMVGSVSSGGAAWARANWVLSSGNTVYTTDLYNLFVIDVTNKSAPVRVGWWASPNSSTYNMRMALVGNYVYTAASTNGVRVIDVSTPTAPTQAALLTFSGTPAQYPNDVAVAGNTLYVSTGSGNMIRYVDVTTPSAPVVLGGGLAITNPQGLRVDVAANRLYVLAYSGLYVYDITTRTSPTFLGSWTAPGWISTVRGTRTLRLNGTRAYVTDDTNRVYVLDVSGNAPALLGSYTGVNGAGTGNGTGNAVYLTGGILPGLTVIDATTLTSPALLHTRGMSIASGNVHRGNYAYVGYSNGLVTLNVTNPASPIQTNAQQISGSSWNAALEGAGSYLYAANGSVLQALGLTNNPAIPNQLGSVSWSFAQPTDIALVGNRAFVSTSGYSGGPNSVSAVDITNPSGLTISGSYTSTDSPTCVAASTSGTTAIMGSSAGIRVLDFTNASTPTLMGSLASGSYNDLALRGSYVYGALNNALNIVDVSTPTAPVNKGTFALPSTIGARSIRMYGNTALVPTGTTNTGLDGRVQLFDLTVPTKPAWIGVVDTLGATVVTADPDGTLYVSQRDSNIGTFKIAQTGSVAVTSGLASVVSLPAGVRHYSVSFTDLYPGLDEVVKCMVSGGTCTVISVDQTAHTAAIDWTMPVVGGDYEIAIAVGNHHYFVSALDRVRAQ